MLYYRLCFIILFSSNLTMYHHHYQQSKLAESSYNEDIPFFREAVTLIDQCTKLMKQDRIALRNKLKQYFKHLKQNRLCQNEWQNEQMQLLIQIFVEANKKKSLNKVQKGDKVMDWLQIKLRKYMDNHKKQKHKKQVEQFRVNKNSQSKKCKQNYHFGEQIKEVTKQNPFRPNLSNNINKLSFKLGSKRSFCINHSLSKSREKDLSVSTRKTSQNKSYNSSSFHQKFSYLKKGKPEDNISPQCKQTQKQKFGPSKNDHNNYIKSQNKNGSSIQKKYNNFLQKGNKYSYKSYLPSQNQSKNNEISKLTQLFTKQLKNDVFQNEEDIINHKKNPEFPPSHNLPLSQTKIKPFLEVFQLKELPKHDDQALKYQKSSKNIQQIFKNTKTLMHNYQYKDSNTFDSFMKNKIPTGKSNQNKQFPYKAQQNYESNSLFTPPDLLAECRRFLSNSNQKRQLEAEESKNSYNNFFNEQPKAMTFSNTINQMKDRNDGKQSKFKQLNINEVTSENNSLNISCKKPNTENNSQVLFKMKMININSIEELLLQIFKNSHKVSLDRFQLGEIMSRCESQVQKYLQSYCDILANQSSGNKFNIDFLAFIKYLYTYGKIFQSNHEYFCISLCEILDIQKKGNVDNYDIEGFLESIENSQLEPYSYGQIKDLLYSIYSSSCRIQGSETIMTYWSLYFFQLKKDKELIRLGQILSKFEFQYDTQQ